MCSSDLFDLKKAATDMATAITELGVTDSNKDGKVDAKDLGTIKFGYNCNAGHLPRVVYLAEHWRTAFGFDQNQFDLSCVTFPELLQQRPQRAGSLDTYRLWQHESRLAGSRTLPRQVV